MPRLPDPDDMEDREDQCPERGVGLTHITDGTPVCVHCQRLVSKKERRYVAKPDAKDDYEYSDDQINKFEFLRFLCRTGRLAGQDDGDPLAT